MTAIPQDETTTPTPVTPPEDVKAARAILGAPGAGRIWARDADGRVPIVPSGPQGGPIHYLVARQDLTAQDAVDAASLGKNGMVSVRTRVVRKLREHTLGMAPWAEVCELGEVYLIFRFVRPLDVDTIRKVTDRYPEAEWVSATRVGEAPKSYCKLHHDMVDQDTLLSTAPVDPGNKAGRSLVSRAAYFRRKGYGGRCRFNTFTDQEELDGLPVDDAVLLKLREGMEGDAEGQPLSTVACEDILKLLCRETRYDPVVQWLDGLKWDGKDRLSTFVADHFGPNPEGTSDLFRRWLISAVARQYRPGCQADLMLILQGDQGWGKDRFFRALLPDRSWYLEEGVDVDGTGGNAPGIRLQGKVIVNFPELSGFSRRENDEIKRFLTLTTDEYRRSYARRETVRSRRCIFAGSTNSDEPLSDYTGNRRYIVLKVAGKLDEAKFRAAREQVWAQAAVLYNAGQPWHLTPEEEVVQARVNDGLLHVDPLILRVVDWGMGRVKPFTLGEALDALGVNRTEQGRWSGKLGLYLAKVGFGSTRVQAGLVRERRWLHPSPVLPPEDPVVLEMFS